MALQVAIATQLDELFNAAFSRSGETGAALGPVHDLIVQKGKTGAVLEAAWTAPLNNLDAVLKAKGYLLGVDPAAPNNKTFYMSGVWILANAIRDETPINLDRADLPTVIAARGGPGASHRNAYLQYLHDNITAIAAAAP
jgi:hypothetical protein